MKFLNMRHRFLNEQPQRLRTIAFSNKTPVGQRCRLRIAAPKNDVKQWIFRNELACQLPSAAVPFIFVTFQTDVHDENMAMMVGNFCEDITHHRLVMVLGAFQCCSLNHLIAPTCQEISEVSALLEIILYDQEPPSMIGIEWDTVRECYDTLPSDLLVPATDEWRRWGHDLLEGKVA